MKSSGKWEMENGKKQRGFEVMDCRMVEHVVMTMAECRWDQLYCGDGNGKWKSVRSREESEPKESIEVNGMECNTDGKWR